ncbi:MAG: hypothetical protein HY711_11470 [Candidatus Melainabacteria bacterium]|nr:hypothetical protein [Candidatus Melainabacteria bacterium]
MLSSPADLQEIVELVPEWRALVAESIGQGRLGLHEILVQIGAKDIFSKVVSADKSRDRFLVLIRDGYFQPHLYKMLTTNQNLRRFWVQRHVPPTTQRQQAMSLSSDLAYKMHGVFLKQLALEQEDGFKVLLPAYIQRTVHNAVVDYIRAEWSWERQTLQDLQLDPEQEDPRQAVADDLRYVPEAQAISSEQVAQLNRLRKELASMLTDSQHPGEPLTVVDCIFGLGLTQHSKQSYEMTMRECCECLGIAGETQARRIARCQVLLDKGLDLIRQHIREKLPGIAEFWQTNLNVNSASRRELTQQLGMTEGEVERLVTNRQYYAIAQLVERGVVKAARLRELINKGAVAAFTPVDLNCATVRDMVDILGLAKDKAQRLTSERPFANLSELTNKGLLSQSELAQIVSRGAVVKVTKANTGRLDLNKTELKDIVAAGVPQPLALKIVNGRPFFTWADLEEFLSCETPVYALLRQKFCLGLSPG